MGCMRSTALFQKVHHPWPTSKSETISHNEASLEQGEVSFLNWAGRFCLSDCIAGQNLSRLHGQPWNQWALWLLTYRGLFSHAKCHSTQTCPGQLPWQLHFESKPLLPEMSRAQRSYQKDGALVRCSQIQQGGDRVTQWWLKQPHLALFEGPVVFVQIFSAQMFPPVVEQEVHHTNAATRSHSPYPCTPPKQTQSRVKCLLKALHGRITPEIAARGILLTQNSACHSSAQIQEFSNHLNKPRW